VKSNRSAAMPRCFVAGRPVVLAAGEAVREEGDRANLAIRSIQQGGQCLARVIAKIETFCGHEHLLRGDRVAMAFAATVAVDGRISTSTNSDGGPLEASKCRHSRAPRMRASGARESRA
jgi:hypothetical protein